MQGRPVPLPGWPRPSVSSELTQLSPGLSTLREPGGPGLSLQNCRVVRECLLCPRNLFLFSFFFSSLLSFMLFFFIFPFFVLFFSFVVGFFFSLFSLSFPRLLCPMQHYFCDAWNTFDALIVVGSIVDIAITEVNVSTWRLYLTVRACSNTHCLSPVYFFLHFIFSSPLPNFHLVFLICLFKLV